MKEPAVSSPLRGVLVAAAVGLAIRFVISFVSSDALRDDAVYYAAAARDLAEGHGYRLHGRPTAYWPVGYPALLGLVFKLFPTGFMAARLVQIAISTASILLASAIARHLFQSDRPAVAVAWMMALAPPQWTYPSVLLSEVAFTGACLAAAWVQIRADRRPEMVMAGLLWGAAALIRPTALPLPFLVALFGRRNGRRRFTALAIVYAAVALTCLPWTLRNLRVLGAPIPISTNAGVNLWMGNHEDATGAYGFTPAMESAARRIGDEVRFDRHARGEALQFIREHPARFLEMFAKKVVILGSPDHTGGDAVFPRTRSFGRKASAILSDLFHAFLLAAFAVALIARRTGLALPLAMVAGFTLIHGISVASPRYLFPATPWLMMAAASAFGDRTRESR